jgi:hypothetical protein
MRMLVPADFRNGEGTSRTGCCGRGLPAALQKLTTTRWSYLVTQRAEASPIKHGQRTTNGK